MNEPLPPRLLPRIAYAPLQILLWAVVPLLILLWVNYGNYETIVGDVESADRWNWIFGLCGNAGLAIGYGILAAVLWFRRSEVSVAVAIAGFVPIFALILHAVWELPGTIPSAAEWILSPETVVIQNLTGVMPTILYFGAVICGGRGRSVAIEVGKALLGLAAVGVLIGICAAVADFGFEVEVGAITTMTLAILVCTFAVLRLLILAGNAMFRRSPMALTLIGLWVGLLLPMIGLWVNAYVPFPYDFQVSWVYAFTAVNGVLLSIPLPANPAGRRLVWFAQCAGLPFTLYFFVVFMPFLPLSVPGLIIWGGGLLVLVPACVLLLHGFRVVDGFRKLRSEANGLQRWGLAFAALAIAPGAVWWNAKSDRITLHQALDFVYVASPHKSARFEADTAPLRRTLAHVQEFKAGKKLPIISAFYNDTVFDGLTLPDTKIKQLSQTFLGEEIEIKSDGGNLWGRGRGFANQNFRVPDPPHTDVSLLPVNTRYHAEGDRFVRTTAMLRMKNQRSEQGEFAGTLTLPKNAAVSGFWLHIGNERVPGRMTEKKASMWVYQMIRDVTRRDPGILRYTAPDQLELRVFPLAGHEIRTVEIEFLASATIEQQVIINGQRIALNDGSQPSDAGICFATSPTGASLAIASRSSSEPLPTTRREPYLHFIIDWCAKSAATPEVIESAIESARVLLPEAKLGTASLVNFEMASVGDQAIPLDRLAEAVDTAMDQLPKRGGFTPGRAMHGILVNRAKQFQFARPGQPEFDQFPVFMIIGAESALDLQGDAMPWLAQLLPDAPDYYRIDIADKNWLATGFEKGTTAGGVLHPVHIFRIGGQNLISRAHVPAIAHAHGGVDVSAVPSLAVFDGGARRFDTVSTAVPLAEGEPYAQALSLWRHQQLALADPSAVGADSLREIVLQSRESGILTNATAYIAVESHAQWKLLEEAEKQKLKAGNAFELSEGPAVSSVPEPSTGLLMLIAAMCLALQRRRIRSSLDFRL
ncbi:MAG: MSEP-CTERM sorting domain-containing protein [Verrucomicrobia bacterium]|nr:MSEP-CTERM sorting domain-containing protein [Verrucomicrobiota bacterium]